MTDFFDVTEYTITTNHKTYNIRVICTISVGGEIRTGGYDSDPVFGKRYDEYLGIVTSNDPYINHFKQPNKIIHYIRKKYEPIRYKLLSIKKLFSSKYLMHEEYCYNAYTRRDYIDTQIYLTIHKIDVLRNSVWKTINITDYDGCNADQYSDQTFEEIKNKYIKLQSSFQDEIWINTMEQETEMTYPIDHYIDYSDDDYSISSDSD